MAVRALWLLVCFVCVALAQDPPPLQPGQLVSPSDKAESEWRGMSVKEKLKYDASHVFEIDNFIFAGIGAAIDQKRNRPGEWGQGWDAFSERYASHIGQYLVQRSIMAPVQAIDHEDTRYFPSKHRSYGARAGDAFLHTIWRHSDDGGMMPAYSELFGDYGAAAVSRTWWPDRYHKGSSIFVAGSDTILIDGGINLFHEFTPDIKRWLHFER